MERRLRDFMEWQAEQLDGAPSAEEVAFQIASRLTTQPGRTIRMELIVLLGALALLVAIGSVIAIVGAQPKPPPVPLLVFARWVAGADHAAVFTSDGAQEMELPASPISADDVPWDIGQACCPAWSPSAQRLLVAATSPDGRQTAAVERADGSGRRLIALPAGDIGLVPGAWSPDGSQIVLEGRGSASTGGGGLFTASVTDNFIPRRLILSPNHHADVPLSYSPDGNWILFLRQSATKHQLFIVRPSGANLRRISSDSVGNVGWGLSPASWSADSRYLGFAVAHSAQTGTSASDILIADVLKHTTQRVGGEHGPIGLAQLSPDGKWIVYDEAGVGGHQLMLVRTDGTDGRVLVSNADAGACCGVWSSDGAFILFQRSAVPGTELTQLWRVRPDGSGLEQLTSIPAVYAWYSLADQ